MAKRPKQDPPVEVVTTTTTTTTTTCTTMAPEIVDAGYDVVTPELRAQVAKLARKHLGHDAVTSAQLVARLSDDQVRRIREVQLLKNARDFIDSILAEPN